MSAIVQSESDETSTRIRDGAPGRSPLGALLRIVTPGRPMSTFRLRPGGACVVGSLDGCDVVVRDAEVSRTHLELSIEPGGVSVRDLGSRNGTYYLGQRLQGMVLAHGASVALGATRIGIEIDQDDFREVFEGSGYRGLAGTSPAMRALFGTLARLEGTQVTVHVTGESGVGKELVASAIHDGSGVSGNLVTVNCGAVSRDLVGSELFGHRRGAFTGAVESRRGAFETAHGGTLFLDEVAELPLDVQPMLLRALESGEIRPVGGDHVERVKVRVVSATHRDLEREVQKGRFREDLYYRLAVIKLVVPPLRERREDIPLIARQFAQSMGTVLSPATLEELRQRPWPGNARELRNAIQAYSVLMSLPPSAAQHSPDLGEALREFIDFGRPYAELKEKLMDSFQHAYLEQLLIRVHGNQSTAAKISGLDRTYLGRLLAKYGIGRPSP